MDSLIQDIRHAVRGLRQSPGFTLVAVLTLALGIGATTTIFSAVRAVILRPLMYPRDGELVQLFHSSAAQTFPAFSPPNFVDLRSQTGSFTDLAAINTGSVALSGEAEAEQVQSAQVTGGFFGVLGVPPLHGRVIGPGDDADGGPAILVISHALWQRRFGADPSVIGRRILVDGVPFEVAGVMPRGFNYPLGVELWTPQAFSLTDLATQRGAFYLDVIGRLRPGIPVAQANADLARVSSILASQYPRTNGKLSALARPLRSALVGDAERPLEILLAAVGMVLLIACVNVATLLLVRGLRRGRELAIRTAVGATAPRLVQGLLVESAVLGLLGALAGVLIAVWGTGVISSLKTAAIPLLDQTRVDGVALAFTIAVALGSALLFGAWPARQAIAQVDLASRFREESGTVSAGGARQRSRSAMVMVQLALATTLLVGAGLLLRSFQQMSRVDLGVSPGGVLTFAVGLPKNYDTPERRTQFVQDLDARLAAIPGATSAGATFFTPFTDFRYNISLSSKDEVVPSESEQARLSVQVRLATPDWFRTMGIALVSGRVFTAQDRSGAAPVAMLNESAARLLWPATDPMGHRLTLGTRLVRGGERINGEVIGVVKDVREFGPTTPATPTVYFAYDQWPVDLVGFAVRGRDASQLLAPARSALVGLDPNVPMYQVRTLEQLMGGLVARPRLYSLLLSIFAGTALLLAAIGVYGVLAAAVAARSREIGVRIALGAERLAVLRDVMLRAWLLALGGVGMGLVAALALGRAVRSLLFDITPADPVTFALVVAGLAGVTMLAAWGPAWRAARVDPMVVLRAE